MTAMQIRNRPKFERWTREKAAQVIEEWKASGESVNAFSQRRGFNEQRLRWWNKRMPEVKGVVHRRRRKVQAPSLKLAAVVPRRGEGTWVIGNAVSVVIGREEIRIEIQDVGTVPPAWLREVVRAIREEGAR